MFDCESERVSESGCGSRAVPLRRRDPACRIAVCLAVASVVLMLLGCARTSSNEPPGQSVKHDSQPAQVAVTISKETTYVVEPLRRDGYPDYVTALNRRSSQDVTPENNAAVPFLKAIGPAVLLPQHREKYCQMLGIPPLPEKGDYFVELDDHVARSKNGTHPPDEKPTADTEVRVWDVLNLAMKRPWSPQEFPVLAQWLAANEIPLTLVVEASQRPRRYDPLCCGEKIPLLVVPLPVIQRYRNVTQALCVRNIAAAPRQVGGGVGGSSDLPPAGSARRPRPDDDRRPHRVFHGGSGVYGGPGPAAARPTRPVPSGKDAGGSQPLTGNAEDGR